MTSSWWLVVSPRTTNYQHTNGPTSVAQRIIFVLEMRIARRFVISGRVQGVGFRWFVRDAAMREGVAGWVMNLPDGRVEAFVEGDAEAVTRVERALRSGPPGARVEPGDRHRRRGEWQLRVFRSNKDTHVDHRSEADDSQRARLPEAGHQLLRHHHPAERPCRPPGDHRSLAAPYESAIHHVVVGIESRGFILGSAVAQRIGAGFIPVGSQESCRRRRSRKIYDLEYGKDALEIHADAIDKGQRVLIVDDVLATGGTAAARDAAGEAARRRAARPRLPHRADVPRREAKLIGENVYSVLKY